MDLNGAKGIEDILDYQIFFLLSFLPTVIPLQSDGWQVISVRMTKLQPFLLQTRTPGPSSIPVLFRKICLIVIQSRFGAPTSRISGELAFLREVCYYGALNMKE